MLQNHQLRMVWTAWSILSMPICRAITDSIGLAVKGTCQPPRWNNGVFLLLAFDHFSRKERKGRSSDDSTLAMLSASRIPVWDVVILICTTENNGVPYSPCPVAVIRNKKITPRKFERVPRISQCPQRSGWSPSNRTALS